MREGFSGLWAEGNTCACAEGTLECGGSTPPSPRGLYALGTLRRRRAAALQGASRIFMYGVRRRIMKSAIKKSRP
jgi:hypothetical protein